MSPSGLLQVYQVYQKTSARRCFFDSAFKAEKMELGEGLTTQAQDHLNQACQFAWRLLQNPNVDFWSKQASESQSK